MASAHPRPLTARQRKFVREYMIDQNARQAAIRAGYSQRSANQTSYRMLRQSPGVMQAVAAAMAKRDERFKVTIDRVVMELARIAFADWREYAEWGKQGLQLKASAEISEDAAAAIVEFQAGDDKHPARIKLHAKRAALDQLARYVGLAGAGRMLLAREQEGKDAREVLRRLLDRVEQMPEPDEANWDEAVARLRQSG